MQTTWDLSSQTSRTKHKKALSSLISPRTTLQLKTHSPSPSQVRMNNFSANLSQIDNFINNHHLLQKTFQKSSEKYLLSNKTQALTCPSPSDQQDLKTKYKNWLLTNQLETSTVFFQKKLTESQPNPGFHPFKTNENIAIPFDLKGSKSELNFLERQLNFNDRQIKLIQESASQLQLEKYQKLYFEIKNKQNFTNNLIQHVSPSKQNHARNTARDSHVDFLDSFEENDDLETQNSQSYKVFLNVMENNDAYNKPGIRESSTITIINFKAYLYGGLSNNLLNTLHELDTNSFEWKKIDFKCDKEFEGRYGHTSVPFRNGFVVYGGEKQYNQAFKRRECLSDVQFFNLETAEWSFVKTWGDFVEGRRNHAALTVSRNMVIYGGINNNGRYLNDVAQFNMDTHKWTICEVEGGGNEDGIAFHSICAVFKQEPKISSIYSPYEYQQIFKKGANGNQTTQKNILEDGIYVFGGKNKSAEISNRLRILKIGKKPLKWIEPETLGEAPACRYQHTMTYQEEFNFLIVYGGRNDQLGVFGDLFLLRVSNLNWYSVTLHGELSGRERFGHCSASINDKFLVFGGVEGKGFVKGELLIFELTPSKVRNLINEETAKKRKLMANSQKEQKLDAIELAGEEKAKKPAKRSESKILIDSLNFSKFKTFMPLPKDDGQTCKKYVENFSKVKIEALGGKTSRAFWKKTLGGVKFLVKIQKTKTKT